VKKHVVAGLIVVSFILLVLSVLFLLQKTREARMIDPLELEGLPREDIIQYIYEKQAESRPLNVFLLPVIGFFGVLIGLLIYYIMEIDIEKKDKTIEHNAGIILKLLDPNERKVIRKIAEDGGKITQMELTYLEGFTKVKAHRVLESLISKGILTKDKMGKQRIIRMNKEFYMILKE
jgi:hypothetical protein